MHKARFGNFRVGSGYPPPPRSTGISDLAEIAGVILGAQSLTGKIFRNKDLRYSPTLPPDAYDPARGSHTSRTLVTVGGAACDRSRTWTSDLGLYGASLSFGPATADQQKSCRALCGGAPGGARLSLCCL